MGTYLHGIFDTPDACKAILDWAGYKTDFAININNRREEGISLITDALESTFDFNAFQVALNLFEKRKELKVEKRNAS